MSDMVLRVVDWDRRYETKATLKKSGPLDVVSVLTDLGRGQIQRLLDLPGGLHAFGIWNILWMLAARCTRRGVLADRGLPLTPHELAKAAKCSVPEIEQAVKLLRSPGVELLERVPLAEALELPEIPPERPRKTKQRFSLPFTHCPNCQVDLVAIVAEMSDCSHHSDDGPHPHAMQLVELPSPDLVVGTADEGGEPPHADDVDSDPCLVHDASVFIELKHRAAAALDAVRSEYLAEVIELEKQLQSGNIPPEFVEQFWGRNHANLMPLVEERS